MKTLRVLMAIVTYMLSSIFIFPFLELIKTIFASPQIKLEWIFLLPFLVTGGFFYAINQKAYSMQMRIIESKYLAEKNMLQNFNMLREKMTDEQKKKVTFNGFITFMAMLISVMIMIMFFTNGYFRALESAISNPGDFGLWIFLLNLIIFIFVFARNSFKNMGVISKDAEITARKMIK